VRGGGGLSGLINPTIAHGHLKMNDLKGHFLFKSIQDAIALLNQREPECHTFFEQAHSMLQDYIIHKQTTSRCDTFDDYVESLLYIMLSNISEIVASNSNEKLETILSTFSHDIEKTVQIGPHSQPVCRENFRKDAIEIFQSWMHLNNSLTPGKVDVEDLSRRTGLTKAQVCQWFANYRKRQKRT